MIHSPLTGPVGFSVSEHITNFEPKLREVARLSPQWYREGLGALELCLNSLDFQTDQSDFTAQQAKILPGLMRDITAGGCRVWSVHLPFGLHYDLSSPDEEIRRWTVDLYCRMMDAAAEGGATVVVAHPSAEPIADADRSLHIEQCRRSIEEITSRIDGVKLAIECLPRTCLCSTAAETKTLLEGTRAGLCMDVNHPHHEPPADFIRQLADKIITVHISDDDGLDEKHWMPGKGVIAWEDVMEEFRRMDYSGAFIYELAPPSGLTGAGIDFTTNYNYLVERWAKKY